MMQQGSKGENPFAGVNVEHVFTAMETLATRQLFDAAPFISGWHPIVEELDSLKIGFRVRHELSQTTQSVNSSIARNIDSALSNLSKQNSSFRSVGNDIRRMVEESLRHLRLEVSGGGEKPGEGRVFGSTCSTMIQKLIGFVWLKPGDHHRVEYLRPLVRYAFKKQTPIATLNYDTTIEVAAQAEGLHVYTYMGEAANSQEEAENLITLLKPHGSINWCSGKTFYPHDVLPETHVVRASEDEMGKRGYTPAVIFGQRNKLTAEGPFLSLFSEFQSQLMRASELIIIGYSLRDHHINESIASWINREPTRTITIVTPDQNWAKQSEFAAKLALLAGVGGRVRVILETAAKAIPALFPVTSTI